ncbi:hypothetical protein [Williamsia sterculiae]|uniref:GNAT family N-acetyltransferase n=1 Tax=Williamsia sterculiae TaxID=1344003 RepID=A0A1N7DZ50_9NOCA|nr:hypothetical protein [Williamsia sterculiae]SIR81147.1 hypothetical protein SAMN05445060_1033 [Williamsia sterculiae]
MEPVEINAGAWYLRALRADDRVDDRPALADLGVVDPAFVTDTAHGWAEETHLSWAVCEPTTGELVALIEARPVDDTHADVTGTARTGHEVALAASLPPVRRFVGGALGLTPLP